MTAYSILKALRLENALHPVLAILVGGVMAGGESVAICFVAMLGVMIHSIATLENDLYDRDIDERQTVNIFRGITNNKATNVTLYLYIGYGVACLIALALSWKTAVVSGLLVFTSWAYNQPPIFGSRHPLRSILLLGLAYATLPLLLGASLGSLDRQIFLLAVGWGISRTSLSILKDYKDAVSDAKFHKKTFLLVHGHSTVRFVSIVGLCLGTCLIVSSIRHQVSDGAFMSMIIVALLLLMLRCRLYQRHTYGELNSVFHDSLKAQVALDALILVALLDTKQGLIWLF